MTDHEAMLIDRVAKLEDDLKGVERSIGMIQKSLDSLYEAHRVVSYRTGTDAETWELRKRRKEIAILLAKGWSSPPAANPGWLSPDGRVMSLEEAIRREEL